MSELRTRSFRNITRSDENLSSLTTFQTEAKAFEDIVPSACDNYDTLYAVIVNKETIHEDAYLKFYEVDKGKRIGRARRPVITNTLFNPSEETDLHPIDSAFAAADDQKRCSKILGTVFVTARYDTADNLREVFIDKVAVLDNITITVIGLVAPQFSTLRKITIKRTGVNPVTIYQINKMLEVTSLTEICLEDLRLPQANYYILLNKTSTLKSLTLCRNHINDDVCKEICERLHYSKPAENHLSLLDLASNDITDVGAKYIAEALRSNRHLRCLNLSDNKISNTGACSIYESLMEFPLTMEELHARRQRQFKYNMRRRATIMGSGAFNLQSLKANMAAKKGGKGKKKKLHSSTGSSSEQGSHIIPDVRTGSPHDPFNVKYTRKINNKIYSIGNLSLVMLNLGYNHITYLGLKKLEELIRYQSENISVDFPGLMRVVIDGNNLPAGCQEYKNIDNLLN